MTTSLQIDLASVSAAMAIQQLRQCENSSDLEVSVTGCNGQKFLANGMRVNGRLAFAGNLGDFCLMSFGNAEATVEGSVGDFFAHSIQDGAIFVRGNAGSSVGALGAGGLISIKGNVEDRAAVALQGADIVVRGNAGAFAGLGLQSGTLVLCGNAGKEMGKGLRGGTIYLRGEVESTSDDIEEVRLREPDRLKIGMIMLKSRINATGKDFRVFRSAR